MEKLYQEGIAARNKHVGVVKKACTKYWEERGTAVAEQVANLVDFPKKKKKANKKKSKKNKSKKE